MNNEIIYNWVFDHVVKNPLQLIKRNKNWMTHLSCAFFFLLYSLPLFTQPISDDDIGLHVTADHVVLFGDSIEADKRKLLWIQSRGALKAGYVAGIDDVNGQVGFYSTVFGFDNFMRHNYSMGWGRGNSSGSSESTIWGRDNFTGADAELATVWGKDNANEAHYGTAWGMNNHLQTSLSTSWGRNNDAFSELATIWGENNEVTAANGTAWGGNNTVSGTRSTALGFNNIASGSTAVAAGVSTEVKGYGATVVGLYNKSFLNEPMATAPIGGFPFENYPLFVVGNGNVVLNGPPNRSNALTVTKYGYVGINKLNLPKADLHIKMSEAFDGNPQNSGGVILEDAGETDAFWQINTANNALHFVRNSNLVAVLSGDGTWQAKAFNEVVFLERPVGKKTTHDVFSKIQIGYDNKGRRGLFKENLLQFAPEIMTKDLQGKPFSVDYQQLYLMAIETIQEQAKKLDVQNEKIKNHEQRLAQIEKKLN